MMTKEQALEALEAIRKEFDCIGSDTLDEIQKAVIGLDDGTVLGEARDNFIGGHPTHAPGGGQ